MIIRSMTGRPIYVELVIRAPFDALWEHTQNPALHARWDLRFSKINYLPRESDNALQRFTYETMIGFGMRVAGTGESVGTHDTPTESTSALQFQSDDPKAIIREGSGYWKYMRSEDGIRFITLYDYRTRHGATGALFDRLIFRPMLGWATAWSFDRLRLWLEAGIDPALSALRAVVHFICRVILAFVWIWHGLVPKIIARHADEIAFLQQANLFEGREVAVTVAAGVGEVLYGILHVGFFRARWMYVLDALLFFGLAIGALMTVPEMIAAPFNPFSLTVILLGVCLTGWIACRDLPSARRCVRRKPERVA